MRGINSQLWWLALLALVPILIHILIRQRLPVVRWAAMTFLLKALRKNRRKLLLETILLLIVRTAIVLAIVLVVVRPVAEAAWAWLGSGGQRTVSVIVLDDSASMAASDGIRTRFDRAVGRIDQYLSELSGGSEVLVVLAGDPPIDLIRLPTRDLTYVRQTLAKLTPRDGTGAIADAVERAEEWLSHLPTPNREIIVVTDTQAADWKRDRAKLRRTLASAARKATVFLVTVPQTPPANVAITGMSVTGGPQALIPSLATTLWPTSVNVQLATSNHEDVVETFVELFVDDDKVARRRVSLSPEHATAVGFEHRFNSAREYAVTARCERDLFDRDNERSIIVQVQERIGVLMVDGRPAADPFASATGFLRVAIWPLLPDDPESVSPFDIRVIPGGGLESVRIADYPLIILADVPALPTSALGQIKSAVRKGAGLLVIAGEQVTGGNLAAMFADGGRGPLPIELAPPIDLAADAEPVGLTLRIPLVPALSSFEAPTLTEALSAAGWRTLRPVAAVQGAAAQVWADFARGGAALVANRYGRGRVVYFGGTADRKGGEFPLSPAFVPFFQQLAFYLLHGADPGSAKAGQPLDWPGDEASPTLVYPDGTSEPAEAMITEDTITGEKRVVLPAADRAGIYALRVTGRDNLPRRLRRAVTVPADESDPAMLQATALADDFLPEGIRAISPDEPMQAALHAARTRAELWPLGLVLLMALVATELVLVWLFAPRQVDADALLQRAMRL